MELFRALGALCETAVGVEPVARALGLGAVPAEHEHTDLFVFQLYPYASVYLGAEGMMGGEARDRVAGFWRAVGLDPPSEPDHLAALLGLYAGLAEAEAAEPDPARRVLRRRARAALLWEHLLTWVPAYLAKLEQVAAPVYLAWGELLGEALRAEAARLEAPERLALALREAPPLEISAEGPRDDVVAALLAPVRCGMIVVRDDLRAAARELGLVARVGERRFVLSALLDSDEPATLAWLAEDAGAWAKRHRAALPADGAAADFWAQRARATADALARRAEAAAGRQGLEPDAAGRVSKARVGSVAVAGGSGGAGAG